MIEILEIFARGGGGGSGGGGGGGSGGGSGILAIPVVVGYYIGFYITRAASRFSESYHLVVSIGLNAAISILLLLGSFITESGIVIIITLMVVGGIWVGWYSAYYSIWKKLGARISASKKKLLAAKKSDASWDASALLAIAHQSFMRYQQDWSNGDYSKFDEYLHPAYASKAKLLLQALIDLNRKNELSDVEIIKMDFLDIIDNRDNEIDIFGVIIEAKMKDVLIDVVSNNILFTDNSTFIEYWYFEREGVTWRPYAIVQGTADEASQNEELVNFANINSMHYSLDMGWLLLPKRGALMARGGFGVSDINNHVIGEWGGHLIQLYNSTSTVNDSEKSLLVGQLTIPKSYDYILVRPNKGVLDFNNPIKAPRESIQYKLEWEDFNNRYDVFSTNQERLATFELLNPGFMAYLYDLDSELALEVVDNIVYFIAPASLSATKYTQLLELLAKAYKELKL